MLTPGSAYSNVSRIKNRYNKIDTHEILKQEIYRQGADIMPTQPTAPAAVITPVQTPVKRGGFEDNELYFDSTQRDMTSDYSIGEIKWNIPTLNNSLNIDNCIAIRTREFYFPKIYPATNSPEYFYFLRVFMEIQTAPSTQAILGPGGNKYHFEFEVKNLTGQSVKLVPINDVFYFRSPIGHLSDLQIRFMVPPATSQAVTFPRIPIPADTVQVMSLVTGGFGYNPIRFSIISNDTTVLGPIGLTGTPGLAVFITGYTSNDPAVNAAVNNINGIFVTNILDINTFEIGGINANTVTAQYMATVYIPKNRIAFPMRFTSITDVSANRIDINHS
jgi:hypothetical protein